MNTQYATETPADAARRLAAGVLAKGYQPAALHEYRDIDGNPLYWRIRCKHADGSKWIRPMHLNGHGYAIGEPEQPDGKPLYRLDALAADEIANVWLVEGENCADMLAKRGILATTSGSSSSADGADWAPLAGRNVTIWPDNDEAGRKYATEAAAKLQALGCTVSVIAADVVASLPEHGDVADWLADNPNGDVTALQTNPIKTAGDIGDTGDALPHNGFSVPKTGDTLGTLGTKPEYVGKRFAADGKTPLPHFVFVERKADGFNGPGVYYVGTHERDGELSHITPQWLCSPLRVAADTRDGQQSEWGRLLVFTDKDGHPHRWAMPMEMLAVDGREIRAALLREGVRITANRNLRPKLEDYLQMAAPGVTARCVTRTGWHADTFVLPRETYGDSDSEPVLFQAPRLDAVNLGQMGDVESWRATVAAPCAGNSRLVLAVSMAFAGPCLGLLHAEGGGLHLRGASSTGKSTALHVAASIYGPPDGYAKTWRATDNGLEGTAALHSDLLLVLDELGQLEPRHAGQVAYLLANGQGKQRSRRDGSQRPPATWRVLFLSAGEVGLGELVTQSGGRVRAGQEVRVIDVPADAGAGLGLFERADATPGAFADGLKAAASKQHGTALPAFAERLTANAETYRETMRALRADIAGELVDSDAPGQVRRVADRFAVIAAAGELATALSLTGWATGEATNAARACFDAWLNGRDTTGNAEPAAMLAQVRAFLEANGEARFTRWDADEEGQRTVNRAGYRKQGSDGPTYYVEVEAFRREVCKGFDSKAVAHVLAEAGALELGGDGRDTQKPRLPDGRRTRVYVVTPALWGDA